MMIDWAAILCSTAGYQVTTTTFIPHLLRAFLLLLIRCPQPDLTLYPPKCFQGEPFREGPLEYTPAPLGVVVRGVNLCHTLPMEVMEQIKRDVSKYRILVFKNQGAVSGDRHVAISHWFGELDAPFAVHHTSPHPKVFRVSNNANLGATGVGISGWHIDGGHREKPYSHALYHIVSVPTKGNTEFVGLKELIESLSPSKRSEWERLWKNDNRTPLKHPLVYAHPETGDKTLCFHNGATSGFTWDLGRPDERTTSAQEGKQIIKDIENEIVKDNGRLVYSHKWEEGDFIISDNLALGHQANTDSQLPVSQVGLRIMHRTTIVGKWIPRKNFTDYEQQKH